MSIATYTDLQAALGNWLDHSLFAARYGDFIALFEAAANRRLRVKEMEALATLTPAADGTVALPSDYLAYRRCTWTGQARNELRYVQPAYFQAAFPTRPADVPRFFTIENLTLKVMPLEFDAGGAGVLPEGPGARQQRDELAAELTSRPLLVRLTRRGGALRRQ